MNYGVALPTRSGTRYLLSGIPPATLQPFLLGELRQIPGVKGSYNSVVDQHGLFIASTNPQRPAGYRLHTAAQVHALHSRNGVIADRYFDRETLPNTGWSIFLSAPQGPLFASVSGFRKWLPWLIFIAFGLVAIASLLLVRRAISDAERVREANEQLTGANVELADAKVSLEEVNDELADSNRALGRSNEELERHARELVRSNAELDQSASIASHDLQEPLRKVRTFTERISETEADTLSERGMDYLRRANASAERMQTLISNAVKFRRESVTPELARDALQDARLANEMKFVVDASKDEADVLSTYDLGVSSFITKPVTFGGLVDVMKTWTQYWFEIVELPNGETSGHARLTGLTDWAPAPGVESRH